MARIKATSIEQIKNRADVLEVVSDVVQLKRRGRNYFGLCPFHEEKTPSFSVNPSMGIFHCFGCGKGGNAISFLMEYEKIDYPEALQRLAERYGIPLEFDEKEVETGRGEISRLYELHEQAADFYHKQLFGPKGKTALAYLHQRGFSDDTLKTFKIGYALPEWETFFRSLEPQKYPPQLLEKSGLLISPEAKRFYDRFRNRIMFPIYSITGRVIAFGGRTLDPDESAKYMNSPESPIYFKSGVLYGLQLSKDAIRQKDDVLMVEGYTDFLRVYTAGFQNVVAGSGTALTFHHVRALKRFSKRVTLCYDGDEAGQKAAERAGYVFLKEGLEVRVLCLPAEDDPDSFLQKHKPEDFTALYQKAAYFIPFCVQLHQEELKSTSAKAAFIESAIQEMAEISNPVVRDLIIKELAENVGAAEAALQSQLRYVLRRQKRPEREAQRKTKPPKRIPLSSAGDRAEYELLKLLLADQKELQELIQQQVQPDDFKHTVMHQLAQKILGILKKGHEFAIADLFTPDLSDDDKHWLARLALEAEPLQAKTELKSEFALAVDCIAVLKTAEIIQNINKLREQLKQAEKQRTDTVALVDELVRLRKRREEIEQQLKSIFRNTT
jgi:DNA primase